MSVEQTVEQIVAYRYPDADRERLRAALEPLIRDDRRVYAVVDDDPTGGQTVHDVEVYTEWSQQALDEAVRRARRMFYVMINSRSLAAEQTAALHQNLTERLVRAAQACGRHVEIISRGDSTLRGHYPLEPDLIDAGCGGGAKQLLIPYFREGNRFTVDDVHYLREGARFLPVGESEFSRDKAFGYRSSNLKKWIEEKSRGQTPATDVASIPLQTLRALDFDAVEAALLGAKRCVVVNAACDDDLRAFAVGYLRAVARGARFVARTAAAWPKVIGDVSDQPLLAGAALVDRDSPFGGLVVVGSHVRKTTQQLERLLRGLPTLEAIELDQHLALQPERLAAEAARVARVATRQLSLGRTCVIHTRRERLDTGGGEKNELFVSRLIADAVSDAVLQIGVKPRFIVAKGGITSSDVAVRSLRIRRATIMGQLEPGVPVWMPDETSRFQRMPYVIFPGNVGDEYTLLHAVQTLLKEGEPT